jgi:heme oxygenase (biliverdin-IX-beta and delta-forming)
VPPIQTIEAARSVRQTLRRATASLHASLDATLSVLTRPDLSIDRYRQVLSAFYGLYAPLERGLTTLNGSQPMLPVSLPSRTAQLEQDLRFIGLSERDVDQLPICGELPNWSGPGHWAGCLYVLEGASLGGQLIARAVERSLGFGAGSGASFFVGEGAHTQVRWSHVSAWLEALARSGTPESALVAGARDTFETFINWCDARQVSQ